MINNAIYDGDGEVVGFRCTTCNGVSRSMWGETCNGCRTAERRHKEMIDAIKTHGSESKTKA